jgi:hypothetical protein
MVILNLQRGGEPNRDVLQVITVHDLQDRQGERVWRWRHAESMDAASGLEEETSPAVSSPGVWAVPAAAAEESAGSGVGGDGVWRRPRSQWSEGGGEVRRLRA